MTDDSESPYYEQGDESYVPSSDDNTILNDAELDAALDYETELTITNEDPIPDSTPDWAKGVAPDIN